MIFFLLFLGQLRATAAVFSFHPALGPCRVSGLSAAAACQHHGAWRPRAGVLTPLIDKLRVIVLENIFGTSEMGERASHATKREGKKWPSRLGAR